MARLGLACLAAGSAVSMPCQAQIPPTAPPLALVIGNADYTALPRLPGCELSANLAAAALSKAGFKVTRQSNPSNARMGAAIAELATQTEAAGSRAVIYVCGYVASYSERLFLLPVEARLERSTDVLSQGIVARLLMSSVAGPGSAAGLVLMDVMPPPDQAEPLGFGSMLRPADLVHAGLAAAALPQSRNAAPAPLASALAEMLAGDRVEVAALVNGLPAQPSLARVPLLAAQPPSRPSWLLGGMPETAASTPPQAPPAPVPPPPAVVPATAAPARPFEPNTADRRRLQLALQRLGYFHGRVSGTFGPDTVSAIRQFQREAGEPVSGQLTASQAAGLLR